MEIQVEKAECEEKSTIKIGVSEIQVFGLESPQIEEAIIFKSTVLIVLCFFKAPTISEWLPLILKGLFWETYEQFLSYNIVTKFVWFLVFGVVSVVADLVFVVVFLLLVCCCSSVDLLFLVMSVSCNAISAMLFLFGDTHRSRLRGEKNNTNKKNKS